MKRKTTNYSRIFLILVLIVLGSFLIILLNPSILGSFISIGRPEYCKEGAIKLGSYVITGECMPERAFAKLPPYPNNLGEIKILVRYGRIRDLTTINEEYYKQPEFYLNWDPEGIGSFFNPPGGYFGAFGFGTYPADTVATMKPGEVIRVGTFFKTSWGVETYQGMQLTTTFPEHAESKTAEMDVYQDPEKTRNYFDISIEPNLFVLEPTFGIFEENWVRNITVVVKVKDDTPPGNYVVGITPIAPPSEIEDEWLIEYGLRYVSAGAHGVGRPFYQLFIEVQ